MRKWRAIIGGESNARLVEEWKYDFGNGRRSFKKREVKKFMHVKII